MVEADGPVTVTMQLTGQTNISVFLVFLTSSGSATGKNTVIFTIAGHTYT